MVAQPQPPRRGAGRGSDRLRAWRRNSRDDGIISSATGSGALVEPRPPEPPQTPTLEPLHPPLPEPQTPLPLPPLAPPRPLFPDEDDDDDDLAPTLPQIPSIPRLPTVPPAARRLAVAADFAAFMCTRNYLHGPRLRGLTTEQRMRLFSLVGRVYLPALNLAGRMPDVDACADDAGYAGYGDDDDE